MCENKGQTAFFVLLILVAMLAGIGAGGIIEEIFNLG